MGADNVTTKHQDPPKWASPVWRTAPELRDLIFGTRAQSTQFGGYIPECKGCHGGGCGAGECSAFTQWDGCDVGGAAWMFDATNNWYYPEGNDFAFSIEDCYCSNRPHCTRVDPTVGFLGKGTSGYDPLWRVDWAESSKYNKNVRFSYDITKIDKIDQAIRFKQLFNPDPNDDSWRRIMNKLCSARSSKCPPDPTEPNSKANSSCSLVTALPNQDGSEQCRQWFNGLNGQNRDTFIEQVCEPTNGIIRTECKCQLRQNLDAYKRITENLYVDHSLVDDACYWTPCKAAGSKTYLVNSRDSNPKCPQNICQAIYLVNGTQGNVNISDNQAYLACKFNSSTTVDPTKPNEQTIPTPPIPIPSSSTSKTKLIIGIVAMIIIVLVAIVLVLRQKKSE